VATVGASATLGATVSVNVEIIVDAVIYNKVEEICESVAH